MIENEIIFQELKINPSYGITIKTVYYIIENNRPRVMDKFRSALTPDEQDDVKSLISRMATRENFQSPKIKWHLKKYDYGEIRPLPHRFFFFKYGNNIIFFDYIEKKTPSLPYKIYKNINN